MEYKAARGASVWCMSTLFILPWETKKFLLDSKEVRNSDSVIAKHAVISFHCYRGICKVMSKLIFTYGMKMSRARALTLPRIFRLNEIEKNIFQVGSFRFWGNTSKNVGKFYLFFYISFHPVTNLMSKLVTRFRNGNHCMNAQN